MKAKSAIKHNSTLRTDLGLQGTGYKFPLCPIYIYDRVKPLRGLFPIGMDLLRRHSASHVINYPIANLNQTNRFSQLSRKEVHAKAQRREERKVPNVISQQYPIYISIIIKIRKSMVENTQLCNNALSFASAYRRTFGPRYDAPLREDYSRKSLRLCERSFKDMSIKE